MNVSATMIVRRYARALLNTAVKQKVETSLRDGLNDLEIVFNEAPRLLETLNNPNMTSQQKASILIALLEKLETPALLSQFVQYIAHKRRLLILPHLPALYSALDDLRLGRVHAYVTTATPVEEAQLKKIETALHATSKKEVVMHTNQDHHLIGGMVVRMNATIWDGSVRGTLQRVRDNLAKG